MQETSIPPTATRTEVTSYGESAQPNWRGVDWREHERSIEIEGHRVNYVDVGAGDEAVLFIHGFSGSWRWWLETLPTIAERRRAIAVDLPGCGHSEMPAQRLSLELWCRQLDEICERLELGRVSVAGFSLGTVVAPQLAIRHPERVDKLALVGGPILSAARLLRHPLSTARRQPRMTAVLASEVMLAPIPLPDRLQRQVARRPRLRELTFAPYARYPKQLASDLIFNAVFPGLGAPGAFPSLRDALTQNVYEELEQIKCPVLAINGANDRLVPTADIEELVLRLPHAQTRLLENTGHWSQLERASAFNAELTSFLDVQ